MFAYCNNNPVNRIDSTGESAGALAKWISTMWWLCLVDSALPFGDAVYLGVMIGLGLAASSTQATAPAASLPTYNYKEKEKSKEKEKEKEYTNTPKPQQQAYFTTNPYDFKPKGLVMTEYPGTKNGRIIEWRDPISQVKIFEWNEDFNKGSHYHAMIIEWDGNHMGTHYLPGTPVPEPWNSIYFGD